MLCGYHLDDMACYAGTTWTTSRAMQVPPGRHCVLCRYHLDDIAYDEVIDDFDQKEEGAKTFADQLAKNSILQKLSKSAVLQKKGVAGQVVHRDVKQTIKDHIDRKNEERKGIGKIFMRKRTTQGKD